MHPKNIIITVFLITGLLVSSGCEQKTVEQGPRYSPENPSAKTTYSFAVHPLHNPAKLIKVYQPLINYLNKQIPDANIILEASRDYASYEAKFKDNRLAFLLPNPWQTMQGMNQGYEVIAMAGNPDDFKGIFIVKKDSPIKTPADIKGKLISYPAPTALAACIMPQYFLHTHGININTDIENRYVGSQESAIMNVSAGESDVGATWPPPWRAFQKDHPQEAMQLKVIWETPPLINNSVMARKDLPKLLKQQVSAALWGLHNTREGKEILNGMETDRFYKADNGSYSIVQRYIERFEKEVRQVRHQ